MKQVLFSISILLLSFQAFGQSVGINTNAPHASAALDVVSSTQGVLVPRMTQAQRNLIATPATGLLVYQTDNTPGFYFYNGSAWTSLSGGTTYTAGTGISIAGNVISNTGDGDNSPTNELELPSQSGQSGKYLTTNGAAASWANVVSGSKAHNTNLMTNSISLLTGYYAPSGATLTNTAASLVEIPVALAGNITSFQVRATTLSGGANSYTLTLVKNGIDTGLSVSFNSDATTGNGVSANATGSTVSVVPGDRLCWKLTQGSTTPGTRIGAAFTID